MIIDATDFNDRPYKVPNQEESRDFISLIERWEEDLAVNHLLGAELWDELKVIHESGSIAEPWLTLINGGTYAYNGKTHQFKGWVDLVKPAIYSYWLPVGAYKNTNVGVVINNTPQQSTVVEDQNSFIVTAWNDFCLKVGIVPGCSYTYRNSFYGFMKANSETFDTWLFTPPQTQNRHGF
jgi:hypothetical protein